MRCAWAAKASPQMQEYHDREWGVPVHDDRRHFEILVLEAAQAGLERVRASGTKLGRPKLHSFDPEEAKRLRDDGKTWNEIVKEMGLPV